MFVKPKPNRKKCILITINIIATLLEFEKIPQKKFSGFFEKSSIFNKNLHPEDDVTNEIWWQFFLMPSPSDSESLNGFFKLLLFSTCLFWVFKDILPENHKRFALFKLVQQNHCSQIFQYLKSNRIKTSYIPHLHPHICQSWTNLNCWWYKNPSWRMWLQSWAKM